MNFLKKYDKSKTIQQILDEREDELKKIIKEDQKRLKECENEDIKINIEKNILYFKTRLQEIYYLLNEIEGVE